MENRTELPAESIQLSRQYRQKLFGIGRCLVVVVVIAVIISIDNNNNNNNAGCF